MSDIPDTPDIPEGRGDAGLEPHPLDEVLPPQVPRVPRQSMEDETVEAWSEASRKANAEIKVHNAAIEHKADMLKAVEATCFPKPPSISQAELDAYADKANAIPVTDKEVTHAMIAEREGLKLDTSDGFKANYYELPKGSTELIDLMTHKDMNSQIGTIFEACYRYGEVSHSAKLRDAKKIKLYIEAEIARLEGRIPTASIRKKEREEEEEIQPRSLHHAKCHKITMGDHCKCTCALYGLIPPSPPSYSPCYSSS
jgi:hypothetical protein